MLHTLIYGGKALTALVWILGIWAWAGAGQLGTDPSFFTQLMRMLLVVTAGGHLFIALGFYFWARPLQLATWANMLQVLVFGMFQVAAVWLKRAEGQ